jgi:hypothetical protein
MKERQLNKYLSGFALWLLVAGAAMLWGAQAKSQAKPVVQRGVVSGRVSLITPAGNIKPARMASVYLIYVYRGEKFPHEDSETAGRLWVGELTKALKEDMEKMSVQNIESRPCYMDLLIYSSSFRKALKWASANKQEWQIITDQTDEEGNFKISVPHPGDYDVLVRGRAGLNEAVWESPNYVTVTLGEETTIKLSSSEVSCVAPGTE